MSTLPADGPLATLLDVDAVMARYAIRDRRAARRVMDAAGSFQIAGRLLVPADSLAVYEQRLANQRRSHGTDPPTRKRQPTTGASPTAEALSPDWWHLDRIPTGKRRRVA